MAKALRGQDVAETLDAIKSLGFQYATQAGVSIGIDDMVVPPEKAAVVERARNDQIAVEQQFLDGLITNRERYNKVIAIWSEATERVSEAMFREMTRVAEDLERQGVAARVAEVRDGDRHAVGYIRELEPGRRSVRAVAVVHR